MAATSLKRKARKNRVVSKQRNQMLKLQSAKPVIKNVDIEEMKESFDKKTPKAKKAKAPKEEKTEQPEKETKSEE